MVLTLLTNMEIQAGEIFYDDTETALAFVEAYGNDEDAKLIMEILENLEKLKWHELAKSALKKLYHSILLQHHGIVLDAISLLCRKCDRYEWEPPLANKLLLLFRLFD